jgi:tRNA nucleotidyltransferase (CCA-adding enzyme)
MVSRLSAQRIRHELDLILEEPNAAAMLHQLSGLDLLQPVHPTLSFDKSMHDRLGNLQTYRQLQQLSPWNITKSRQFDGSELGWLLWLMSLSADDINSLNDRLQFSGDLLASLLAASLMFEEQASYVHLKPSECVERLESLPVNAVEALGYVAEDPRAKDRLEKFISKWRYIKPHTTGDDLKSMGVEPGPRYAILLRRLRNAWLDGEVITKDEEIKLLKAIISEN